jgi:hypothetical protein
MSKFFYIIVSFYPIENTKSGFMDRLFGTGGSQLALRKRRELFDTYKNQLWQRLDHISAAISSTGVKVTPLKTEELIELLYNSYNPTTHSNTIIRDVEKVELR